MFRDPGDVVNRERFEALVEAYGASLDRFPAEERSDAETFLAEHEDARALLVYEGELDALLDATSERELPVGLADRILASAPGSTSMESSPPANVIRLRPPQRVATGFFFAAAAAAGLWFGAQQNGEIYEGALEDPEQLAAAFDPLDWEEDAQ